MPKPSPEPYLLRAGPIGVLLIHGFTASPTELRPVGTHLHERGFTVSGARLAGHGTDLGDLRTTRWGDWIESAHSSLEQLTTLCERVYVVGLSMGGVIAARLAADHPSSVAGIALLAPAFRVQTRFLWLAPLLHPLLPDLPKGTRSMQYFSEHGLFTYDAMPACALAQLEKLIRSTRPRVNAIKQPACIFMGMKEHTVWPDSAFDLWRALPSDHKRLYFLPSSGHILSVEPDAPYITQVLGSFIEDCEHRAVLHSDET
ncbi:MAG: alpha/beta hydrolase [Candidatus Latescibacterota bacterium]